MDESTRMMAIAGAVSAAFAVAAWLGDYRRMRRSNLDRVGFMPWTGVFFWAFLLGVLLLGGAGLSFIKG